MAEYYDTPPVANPETASTPVDTDVTIDLLANDYDPDGDPISLYYTPIADHGWCEVNPDGTITYHPNPGFVGEDVITYTIIDDDSNAVEGTCAVTVGTGDGIVEGTAGDDRITVFYTGDPEGDRVDHLDEILPGEGPNDDIIHAYGGDDTVYASVGDDEIIGGDGSDVVYGEDGDDVIDTSGGAPASDYGWPAGGIAPDADPNDDRDEVYGGAGNDTITTGDDADTISGGGGMDSIDGGLDDDEIEAEAGDDFVIGGHGSDLIYGGDGNDEIWGGMGAGTDPYSLPDDIDPVPTNGMDTVYGGAGDDTIYGQDDNDLLYGEEGDDVIDGGIDDDWIDGGDDDDRLSGGEGDDTILGGAGSDRITTGEGADEVWGGDDRDLIGGVNAGDTVDGGAGGDDWDVLNLGGSKPAGGSYVVTTTGADSNGNGMDGYVTYYDAAGDVTGTLEFTEIEEIVPCFTPGTMIATPRGERLVETLEVGDRVITRDNGIQEIRWVGHKPMGWRELGAAQHLKPILIRAGALGNGLPERDMLVSPNHRVLVANDRTALYFEESEVLVAAKHLVDNKGIAQVETMSTAYIHFMFDRHEVVLSDGAWTESFQPGDYSLKGIGNAQRAEIYELFPELEHAEGLEEYGAARRILKKHEARVLIM